MYIKSAGIASTIRPSAIRDIHKIYMTDTQWIIVAPPTYDLRPIPVSTIKETHSRAPTAHEPNCCVTLCQG